MFGNHSGSLLDSLGHVIVYHTGSQNIQYIFLMVELQRFDEAAFEVLYVFQRNIVEQTVRTTIQDSNLLFHRHRAVLGLNKQLSVLTSLIDGHCRNRVHITAEFGESFQFTILRLIHLQCSGHLLHCLDLGVTTYTGYRDTDGQIFLETDLFNQGVRPAINVGISVSRVGGNAQIKAMKKVAGTLKIDQAQYRELEAFSKFSSDMDPITALTIDKGRKNGQLLIQPQYSPMPVEQQIAILYCGTHGLLHDVPLDKVQDFERSFIESLQLNHQEDVLDVLKTGVIDDNVIKAIEETAAMVTKQFI